MTSSTPHSASAREPNDQIGQAVKLKVFHCDDPPGEDGGNSAAASAIASHDEPRHRDTDSAGAAPDVAIPEAPDDPHRLARAIFAKFKHPDGPTLAYYRHDFYVYDGTAYRLARDFEPKMFECVKAILDEQYRTAARERASRIADPASIGRSDPTRSSGKTVPRVTSSLVRDVRRNLSALALVESEADAPSWRTSQAGDPDPINVMPTRNWLVDLGSDPPTIIPHTPRFFSTYSLPHVYDPGAPRPEAWLRFLNAQWGDDPESIDSLHEVLGYLLTPDTSLQKMFLLIGPTGSGRSRMKNVIMRLVGEHNCAASSAVALNGDFGLEALIGKTVTILADLRLGREAPVMLDRLLRIVGCDPVEVNRKGTKMLSGVLMRTRFVVLSNEVPELRDASNAINRRYHILQTTKTIPEGQRDGDLDKKLAAEATGILNLAIEGRKRLKDRGRFIQPASAQELVEAAKDLASPITQFVRERLRAREGARISKVEAYRLWVAWANESGHTPGTLATFGKLMLAAIPKLTFSRPRIDGRQIPSYEGFEASTLPDPQLSSGEVG